MSPNHLDLVFICKNRTISLFWNLIKTKPDWIWTQVSFFGSLGNMFLRSPSWGNLLSESIRLWMFILFYFYPVAFSRMLYNSYDSIPKCSKKPLLNRAVTLSSLPRSCYALLFSYPIIIIFYVCVNWSIGTPLKFVYCTINQPSATSTPPGSWHTHTHTLHLALV